MAYYIWGMRCGIRIGFWQISLIIFQHLFMMSWTGYFFVTSPCTMCAKFLTVKIAGYAILSMLLVEYLNKSANAYKQSYRSYTFL